MNYLSKQIVFREIPDEISLSYLIAGCPIRCPGCHSKDSWNSKVGHLLSRENLNEDLDQYEGWITCVLFMGGEWESEELEGHLQLCKNRGLKTALYTGLDDVSLMLKKDLDYLKTGPYRPELGGLSSQTTNQKLINLKTGKVLNKFFYMAKEAQYDSLK